MWKFYTQQTYTRNAWLTAQKIKFSIKDFGSDLF